MREPRVIRNGGTAGDRTVALERGVLRRDLGQAREITSGLLDITELLRDRCGVSYEKGNAIRGHAAAQLVRQTDYP